MSINIQGSSWRENGGLGKISVRQMAFLSRKNCETRASNHHKPSLFLRWKIQALAYAIWCKISTSSHRPQKPSLQSQLGLKAHPKTAPFQPGLAFDNPEFKHDSPFPFEVGGSDLRHRSWHRIHGVHGWLPCNFERNAASPPGTHGFWIGTSALNPCDTLMPLKKLMGPMSWGPWSISLVLR